MDPPPFVSCRAAVAAWREHPIMTFPPAYEHFAGWLQTLSADPAANRLVEGIVLRIRREDGPEAIRTWAEGFARRRGISLPPLPGTVR